MSYLYDVFISYRRYGRWSEWVRERFMEIFDLYLAEELGCPPNIYIDDKIAEGNAWPHDLARALARSKVLVALWTPLYFNSRWCISELAHMHAREQQCGFRNREHPEGLIVPATLHDGDDFPSQAKIIQMADLRDCAKPWAVRDGQVIQDLAQRICAWTPQVARAIRHAPAFDPTWQDLAFDSFMDLFAKMALEQTILPSLGDV